MKRYLLYALFVFWFGQLAAQDQELTDQNPRYKNSLLKYAATADSLLSSQGATLQETYKAYDWYQARKEKRALRRERRHQERLNNPYYDDYWYYPTIGYRNFGYTNWGWHPYWNSWNSGVWIGF